MPSIDLESPLNFRDLLADIADTTEQQITLLDPVSVLTSGQPKTVAEIALDNGYVMTFEAHEHGSEVFTYMSIADPSSVDGELPSFISIRDEALELGDLADIEKYFDGTIIFGGFLDDLARYKIWSTNNDAVVAGFNNAALHVGVGTIKGRGGDDAITLTTDGLFAQPESHGRALGGYGDDRIQVWVENAFVAGGVGNDMLFFGQGRSTAKGGPGEDMFFFMSYDTFFSDPRDGYTDTPVRAHIRDFDPSDDDLVFFFNSGLQGERVERSLADMFGSGDLSTVDDFTVDGVTFTFHENAKGTSIITRSGTDGNGLVYDERVVMRETTLDEINRADVLLYADESLFLG